MSDQYLIMSTIKCATTVYVTKCVVIKCAYFTKCRWSLCHKCVTRVYGTKI